MDQEPTLTLPLIPPGGTFTFVNPMHYRIRVKGIGEGFNCDPIYIEPGATFTYTQPKDGAA